MDLVVHPVTDVLRAISPSVEPEPVLYALHVIALIAAAIWPDFVALPVLLVSEPHALIDCATRMLELTVSMGLAVNPVAIVDLASDVRKSAFAMSLAKEPLAIVNCAILKSNTSLSMPEAAKPLTFVASFCHLIGVLAELQLLFVHETYVAQLVLLFSQRLVIISVFEVNYLIKFTCLICSDRHTFVLLNQLPAEESLQLEDVCQELDLVFFLVCPRFLRFSRALGNVSVIE